MANATNFRHWGDILDHKVLKSVLLFHFTLSYFIFVLLKKHEGMSCFYFMRNQSYYNFLKHSDEAKLKAHCYGCLKSNSHRLLTLLFAKVIPRFRQLGKHSLKMSH